MVAKSSLVKKNTHKKYRDPPPPGILRCPGHKIPEILWALWERGWALGRYCFRGGPVRPATVLGLSLNGPDWADSPVGRAALAWDGVNAPLARQGG